MSKKLLIQIVSIFLLVLGILGFVNNPVFGLFHVDPMHNLVHIFLGGAGLYISRKQTQTLHSYIKIMTGITALLTLTGFLFLSHDGNLFGTVNWNSANNYLHLTLFLFFTSMSFSKK